MYTVNGLDEHRSTFLFWFYRNVKYIYLCYFETVALYKNVLKVTEELVKVFWD